MKRAILALMLLAGGGWSQQNGTEKVQKVITLKYADPQALRGLLTVFPVVAIPDPRMNVIALTGSPAAVATAEQVIKQLDVPPKVIDLTVYFVEGTDEATPKLSSIPSDLESTVATLKQTFPFKTYGLLDALSLRTRAGSGASATGEASSGNLAEFGVRTASIGGEGDTIRLDHLHAGLKRLQMPAPGKISYANVSGLDADALDVKEGQKLVIGRTSLEGPPGNPAGSKALFLILIAKVAQ